MAEARTDLAACFDLKSAGTYRVTAHDQDGTDAVPPAPAGARHVAEELLSDTLEIEVGPEG